MFKDIFSDKKFWLFDLDNTIYSPDTKVFDEIDSRMKKYISKLLKISRMRHLKFRNFIIKNLGLRCLV